MARGNDASSPLQIPAKGWKDIAFRVKDEVANDHISLIAAGIAFYGLLAIFPGIAACMAIAGLVTEPSTIVNQIESYGRLLPQEAAQIIVSQASSVAGSREGGLGLAAIVGLLLALYSASKGVQAMIEGLNVAYEETNTRGFIQGYLVTFGFTLFLIVGVLVSMGFTIVLPAVFALLPFSGVTETVVGLLRWPLLAAMAIFGLSVIYRYGPSRATPKWRWVTPGAIMACILWLAGSAAFAVYVSNFGSYNETFGSLAGAIILLMWLWLSAFIVLLGAEIDAEMEAQTHLDSTTGKPLPMGERGAVKADQAAT